MAEWEFRKFTNILQPLIQKIFKFQGKNEALPCAGEKRFKTILSLKFFFNFHILKI